MSDILIRQAEPEDGPALVAAIAAIDAETEFLGRPGEYGDWPEKASERLKTWREKDTGGYVLAIANGEIVGFLSIFRGGLKRAAGAGTIPHVGLRAAHRGQASVASCSRRRRPGPGAMTCIGSSFGSTRRTPAAVPSTRAWASRSKVPSRARSTMTEPGGRI